MSASHWPTTGLKHSWSVPGVPWRYPGWSTNPTVLGAQGSGTQSSEHPLPTHTPYWTQGSLNPWVSNDFWVPSTTLGWQSRPGKGAMATCLLSFESTGSGSCCQATLTLETAVGLPPPPALCAPAQRHQWAAGSSGGQAPVGEEGCPRPAPPDPAPPPYLIKPPQDQAHQRMIILSELCMVLYLREITFNDLDKIFVLCSGDFFPCCGFLVVPSSLAGVWGVPMVSCGLLPRQNQASEQAWPGPASLDASLVLDTCYGQTCSAV